MQVRVKLMGTLRSKLPPGTPGGVATLEVEPDTTVADLLVRLVVGGSHVHLVLLNGTMETNRQRVLSAKRNPRKYAVGGIDFCRIDKRNGAKHKIVIAKMRSESKR